MSRLWQLKVVDGTGGSAAARSTDGAFPPRGRHAANRVRRRRSASCRLAPSGVAGLHRPAATAGDRRLEGFQR